MLEAVLGWWKGGGDRRRGWLGGGVEAASVKMIGLGERGACRVVSWWGVVVTGVTGVASAAASKQLLNIHN